MFNSTRALVTMVVVALGAVAPQALGQSNYPNKAIRLIVPFSPGGGTDIVARALAARLSEAFGQPVVVDNRGGAGGSIGAEMGVRAAPDGYTMTMVSTSYAVNPSLYKLPYHPVNDVQPISEIGSGGFIVSVHPSVPAKDIKELIGLAKSKPGSLNFGSTGTGGITQLVTELFKLKTGVNIVHIPFKGTGPAISDLIGGQIQILFGSVPSIIPQLKSGRLRALAVTTAKRVDAVPNLPTVAETVPGYEGLVWYGVFGPKGLPPAVAQRWSREIGVAVRSKDLVVRLESGGLEPIGGSPEEFAKQLREDIAKWAEVVKAANIKL